MKNNRKLEQIEDVMLEQIDILRNIDVKDKSRYMESVDRCKAIALLCDKIIQSQNTQLKQDIWDTTKKYRRMKAKAITMAETEPKEIDDKGYAETDEDECA